MQGLRTREDERFVEFFNLVQKEARKKNCVFFLDFGECKDIEFKNMIIDDLFGWLIPQGKADNFETLFNNEKISREWDRYCCWVLPNIEDGKLSIMIE